MKCLTVLSILFGILFFSACESQLQVVEISNKEALNYIEKNKDFLLLDVRTREEFNEAHINGAINVPYDELHYRIDEIINYKNKDVFVYCRTKNRSSAAKDTLIYYNFKKIYVMHEGFSNWGYGLVNNY